MAFVVYQRNGDGYVRVFVEDTIQKCEDFIESIAKSPVISFARMNYYLQGNTHDMPDFRIIPE